MTTKAQQHTPIIGLARLNLEPHQVEYLYECLAAGKNWFVIRKRSNGRCIQASGTSQERVQRTLNGWPGSTLVKVQDSRIVWPNAAIARATT
jgi:hypothetical protein